MPPREDGSSDGFRPDHHRGQTERVSPMNHISKIAIAIVAVALVIVIGLIVLSANTKKTETLEATAQQIAQATEIPAAEPTKAPEEEAQDEAQVNGEMYEGALAGLTEEEIGRLAMAEEQNGSEAAGEETAEGEGTNNEIVAGVAD